MTTYKLTGENYVIKDGETKVPIANTPEFPNTNPDYLAYKAWLAAGGVPEPAPPPSQFDLDQARYQKRAAVKDSLIAWMAADNMGRVRAGAWSVPELTSLMSDPAVAAANAYMSTLSFELAAQSILAATTPLLTPEIKAAWVGKLQEHFYLEG
jgi:hypothetical protein